MNTRSLSLSQAASAESFTPLVTGILQRKCASCGQHTIAGGECTECGKKKQFLQRRAVNQAEASEVPPIVHDVLRSPGQPLDATTRAFMEPRFGQDFNGVKVHMDAGEPSHFRRISQLENKYLQEAEQPAQENRQSYENEEQIRSPQEKEIPKDKDEHSLSEGQKNSSFNHKNIITTVELPWTTGHDMPQNLSRQGIKTILRPRQVPQTVRGILPPITGLESAKNTAVAPGGIPTVNNSAASNDCLPSTASAVLHWDVVSADANNWGVNVNSLTLAGQINISPWPSQPTSMVVPNTPNPVDGGNINNTAGSPNHWQAVIDDMANYNSPGGGAGPNWHSTAASSAHEWTHWNTDYITDSVLSAAGGNWTQTNADLDALRAPKANHPTDVDARTALEPRVNARLERWRSRTISRWNAIPDSPGVAGSTGYAAGMAVLNILIAAVRAYAASKGWTGGAPAPTPTPTPSLSRGAKTALGAGAGALIGAGIGAFGGPVGAAIGAGVGAIAGGILGLFL